jgi:DNA-binding IclR family transcriptional regulator
MPDLADPNSEVVMAPSGSSELPPQRGLPRRRTPGVESPRKVLQMLLRYSEDQPTASIQELAAEVDVPISTAYRYVSLLRELGLLEETAGARYSVAPRIMGVARAAQAVNSLAALARPLLHDLAEEINETIMLVRMIGGAPVCVEKIESSRPVRLSVQLGQPLRLDVGASGKTLLAFQPEREREAFLEARCQFDPAFADRVGDLRTELKEIAERGWAISRGEIDEGIWACSAAIRRGDRAVGTLTVAAPAYRIADEDQPGILERLRESSAEIAGKLAQRPDSA